MRLYPVVVFSLGLLLGQISKVPFRQVDVPADAASQFRFLVADAEGNTGQRWLGQGLTTTNSTVDVDTAIVVTKSGINDLRGAYYLNGTVGGTADVDLSGALRTRLKTSAIDPPTCMEGDWFYSTAVHAPKICIAPNTWRQL